VVPDARPRSEQLSLEAGSNGLPFRYGGSGACPGDNALDQVLVGYTARRHGVTE
jgi:hypothetical protein